MSSETPPTTLNEGEVEKTSNDKRFTSTAIVDYNARNEKEISFKEGDTVIVIEDRGNGFLYGECNNSFGFQTGIFPLKFVVIDDFIEKVSNKQKLIGKMKTLKEELNKTKANRNDIQEEVKRLREEKDRMSVENAPIIYSLRTKEHLKLHLLQFDIKMVRLSEGMQSLRATMINSLQELSKFKSNIESTDLEPFKENILDKIENLRIKTGFVQQQLFDSISKSKVVYDQVDLLHKTIENPQSVNQIKQEEQVEAKPRKFVMGVKPSLENLKNI